MRVPGTPRRSNQLILKEINPDYSLEGLMLKLQYCGHLMQKVDSFGKVSSFPDAGKHLRQEKGMAKDKVVGWHH